MSTPRFIEVSTSSSMRSPFISDRLFEQLGVHLEADGGDLARLLAAEDVSGAADFEIAGGDAESGAEVGKLLDGGQALARVGGQDAIARNEQIAEGEAVAAS